MHVGFLFWDAFQWSGEAFPDKSLAFIPGYTGNVLMAKAYRWYEELYGEQLKTSMAYGFSPAILGNSVWRVRAGLTYGSVHLFVDRDLSNRGRVLVGGGEHGPASYNILCAVEDLPQGLVNRLPDVALRNHMDFHLLMHGALQWRESLPGTELFNMARGDYDDSTESVLGRRYGQARWAAQQALEKTLKGFLTIAGTSYAAKGPKGHSLAHAAQLLKDHHGVALSAPVLAAAECPPAVRYGEIDSTESQALLANHAVLAILDELQRSPQAKVLLAGYEEVN